jgi:hypothetical protein
MEDHISEDILAISQPAIEQWTLSSLQLGDAVADHLSRRFQYTASDAPLPF